MTRAGLKTDSEMRHLKERNRDWNGNLNFSDVFKEAQGHLRKVKSLLIGLSMQTCETIYGALVKPWKY